jgi:hypothetical protein
MGCTWKGCVRAGSKRSATCRHSMIFCGSTWPSSARSTKHQGRGRPGAGLGFARAHPWRAGPVARLGSRMAPLVSAASRAVRPENSLLALAAGCDDRRMTTRRFPAPVAGTCATPLTGVAAGTVHGMAIVVPASRGAGKYRIILASGEVVACNGGRASFVVVVEVLVAERDPEHPLADKGAARK